MAQLGEPATVVEHRDLPTYAHAAKCSCGFFSAGTKEDPALFSDHLMSLTMAGHY